MKIFRFLTPKMPKIMISERKRPFKFNLGFNNQQNLLILGLLTAFTNQKILQRLDFWIFDFISRFCHFLGVKISKMEDKIKIGAPRSFFILLQSVSNQKIMSIEQSLREFLNFRGESWIYCKLYWKSYIFENRSKL